MSADLVRLVRAEAEARSKLYAKASFRDAGGDVPDSELRYLSRQQRTALDALLAAGDELIRVDVAVA